MSRCHDAFFERPASTTVTHEDPLMIAFSTGPYDEAPCDVGTGTPYDGGSHRNPPGKVTFAAATKIDPRVSEAPGGAGWPFLERSCAQCPLDQMVTGE